MAAAAARRGHLELVKWLCGEGDFAMDARLEFEAVHGGHAELLQWLQTHEVPH